MTPCSDICSGLQSCTRERSDWFGGMSITRCWPMRRQAGAHANTPSPAAACHTSPSSAGVPHQNPPGQSEHGPECNSSCIAFPVNQ